MALFVAASCLLAGALRLPWIGAHRLASAEQAVLVQSQGLDTQAPIPPGERVDGDRLPRRRGFWSIARHTLSSPLHTGLLALWAEGAGASETALRLPSAAAGVATVAVIALVAGHLAGPWAAGAAGLLLALSPIHTLTSREATPGAMLVLMVALSLWLALRLEARGRLRTAVGLGVLLGLLATGPSTLVVLAVLLLAWLVSRRDRWRAGGIASAVALGIFGAAQAWWRLPLVGGDGLDWVPGTTLPGIVRCAGASFTQLAGLEHHLLLPQARYALPLTLGVVALALLGARVLPARARWLLLGGVALPFVGAALLAGWMGRVTPLQASRMLPALPFLAILVGAGLASLRGWRLWTATLVPGAAAVFVALALAAPPREASPSWILAREVSHCRTAGTTTFVQRPLDLLTLVAWEVPGGFVVGGASSGPGIRVGPSTACLLALESPGCGLPACPSP